jgi:hypothetical protein
LQPLLTFSKLLRKKVDGREAVLVCSLLSMPGASLEKRGWSGFVLKRVIQVLETGLSSKHLLEYLSLEYDI